MALCWSALQRPEAGRYQAPKGPYAAVVSGCSRMLRVAPGCSRCIDDAEMIMHHPPISPEEIGPDTTVGSIVAYVLSLPSHAHVAATEDCLDKLRRLAQTERRAHYAARAAELARRPPRPRIRRSEFGGINVGILSSISIELEGGGPVRVDFNGFVPDEKEWGGGEPDRVNIEFAKRVLRCCGSNWASGGISSRELAGLVKAKIAEVPPWREAAFELDPGPLGSVMHGAVIVAAYELGWTVKRDGWAAVLTVPSTSRRPVR